MGIGIRHISVHGTEIGQQLSINEIFLKPEHIA